MALEASGWTYGHLVTFVRPILSHFLSGQTDILSANSCNVLSVKCLVTPGDILFIHYLQLGRHPVAGVVTCYISTDYEDFTLKFRYGGENSNDTIGNRTRDLPACSAPYSR